MTAPDPVTLDLSARVIDVIVTRGDAWSYQVTVTGTDLTGWDIRSQLRATHDATDAVDLDIAPTDLAGGVFHIGQDAATISGLYDVQLAPPDGLARTYVAGRLTVRKDVTRP